MKYTIEDVVFYCDWHRYQFYILPTILLDKMLGNYKDIGFYWLKFRIGLFFIIKYKS